MRSMKSMSKFLALVLTVIMVVSLFPVQAAAASVRTVTVGPSGCNYQSISAALKAYSSNVVINVKAGTYNEQIKITGSNVTINCEDGVVLSGIGMSNNGDMLTIGDDDLKISNITINNLEIADYIIQGDKKEIVGIRVTGKVDNVSILNCTIHDLGCGEYIRQYRDDDSRCPNAHGIIVEGCTDDGEDGKITNVVVSGCELYNLTLGQSEALVFNGNVSGITCSNNYVHDCDNIGIDFIGYEGDGSEADRAHNADCFNNRVEDCSSRTNKTYSGSCCDGIYVDGGYDIRIYDNFVSKCDIGIEVASEHENKTTSDVTVKNNIIIAGDLYGISMGGSDSDNNGYAVGCVIENNTVYSANRDVPCFNVQNASSDTNHVSRNLFISKNGDFISYGDDYNNSGNKIADNKNINNATVSYDATNRTITVTTSQSISGYGAANTIVPGQSTPATVAPTATPTATQTATPTATPTVAPTATPTVAPTATPTVAPTVAPTATPTATATPVVTATPTATATPMVTATPTAEPTVEPTVEPTAPNVTAQQPYATITVDQHKSDWDNIPTADSEFTQYVRGAKIEYVKVCYDDTYDYLMFNASSFGSGYQIYIDADNNESTGFDGYDYLIENDRLYVSTGTGWNWQRLTPAESDFTLSRRDSSRHFVEVRFNRAAMNMSTSYSYDVVLLDRSFNVTYEVSGGVN